MSFGPPHGAISHFLRTFDAMADFGGLRIAEGLGLSSAGEPDPAEEVTDDECDAFAPDDDERICGLHMRFEPPNPPMHIRELWATEARYYPLPPGVE